MPRYKTPLAFLLVLFVAFTAAAQAPTLKNSAPAPSPSASTKSAAPADYSQEPFVMELISSKMVFENDGTCNSEVTVRLRIQSQAGLQAFGLLNLPYASAMQTLDIVSVRVTKPDHRVIETPPENAIEMPAEITRQAPFYSDLKEKQVAVRGLEIGDTLEFVRKEHLHTPIFPGQFWFSYNFFKAGIILDDTMQVSVPRNRYVNVESPGIKPVVTENGPYTVYTWKSSKLERKEDEDNDDSGSADPDEPNRASVQMTTLRNWSELGDWFSALATPRAAVTPDIQQKALELTRDAKTDSEKIQAVYRFVSEKFRYIGVSLGVGRYQPHHAADVLANDYGDCKDKHTLFVALLAAVGIKAYPALISSSQKIDPGFVLPSQFDHVITAVPREKGFLFLDTTPEVAPFGFLIAELRDKQALVVAEGPAQLVKTPADPPYDSFFNFQSEATLDDSGTLESKMDMSMRGDPELSYRYAFRRAGQPEWKNVMQQISSNFGYGGTVSDVSISPLEETSQPFQIKYQYERKEYSDWENRRLTLPCPPLSWPAPPKESDTKKHPKPVKLGTPFTYHFQGTLKLPSNSRPHLLSPVDLHEAFGEYRSIYTLSSGTLHYERTLISKNREIPVAQLDTYRKFLKSIENDTTTYITLRPEDFSSNESSSNEDAQEFYRQGGEAWRRKDMPEAARLYQLALDKDPKYAGPMYWLGAAHVALGQTDRGIDELKKSLTLDPSQEGNYRYVCSLLASHHRETEALDLWKQLRKIDPDAPFASEAIVQLLFSLKRYSDVIPELESSIERFPGVYRLQLQLGEAYALSGNSEKASAAFDKALELDSSTNTLNSVAYTMADNNIRLADALKLSQKAVADAEDKSSDISFENLLESDVSSAPTLAAFWDTLGWIQFRLGHFDLAEKYLIAAWLLGQDPLIGDHLGQVYEKLGKNRDAIAAYSRALAAGRAPDETKARLNALRSAGKSHSGGVESQTDLQEQRTYHLAQLASEHASAEFYVLIKSGPRPTEARFISGSDLLRGAGKSITGLQFNVLFPDSAETQVLRRGILDCEPELPGCVFVLIPPASVKFTKLSDN